MTTKNQQGHQRVHRHRGIDFICIPGSDRERVLLNLFAAEDRLSMRPEIFDDVPGGAWLLPMIVGAVSGVCLGLAVGWLV